MAVLIFSMLLSGFIQPTRAIDAASGGDGAAAINFIGTRNGGIEQPMGGSILSNATGPLEPFFGSVAYLYMSGRYSFDGIYAGTGVSITGFDSLSNHPAAQYVFDYTGYVLTDASTFITDTEAHDYGHEYRTYNGANASWTMYDISGFSPVVVASGTMDDLKADIFYDPANQGVNHSVCGSSSLTVNPAGAGSLYDELMTRYNTNKLDFIYNSTTPPITAENPDDLLEDQYAIFDFDITLTPAVAANTISGTVTALDSGEELAGITIIIMNKNEFSEKFYGTTDENGYYSIPVPPGEQYYVIAFPRGNNQLYANSFYAATAGGGNPVDIATPVDPGTSEVDFALIPGGSIAGTVKDEYDKPISDISVKCQRTDVANGWYDWATTDGEGNYDVAGLPYGTYTISAPDAPNAAIKTIEDNYWMQTQLTDIVIDAGTPDRTAVNLSLQPVDHPVVTNVWPKWMAAGTSGSWLSINGVGFDTLGEGKSLKLVMNAGTGGPTVVAHSSEIEVGDHGRWLIVRMVSDITLPVDTSLTCYPTLDLTDNANTYTEFVGDDWIGMTTEPLVYGNVEPWAISGQDNAELWLEGANLTILGTSQIPVYMARKDDPQQIYFGTAQAVIDNGWQYLKANFDFGNLHLAAGDYYIAANDPAITIHGMVDLPDVKDTVTSVEVVGTPAVTKVFPQSDNKLYIEGINFDQFTNTEKLAGVITLQENPAVNYTQTVTRISNTLLVADLPAGIMAGKNYDFDLYDHARDSNEQLIPQTRGFYLPGEDNCFIATAAFGSKFQPAVALLRQFRDRFLLTNDPGRAFVAFYYKNSPPIAAYIAGNENLKAMVRVLLTPAITIAYLMLHPWMLYVLLILSVTALLWRRKMQRTIQF